MIAVENKIQEIVNNHKSGSSTGITSVCSSNFYVIKAAIVNAKKNNRPVLIESTSNQVDQYGGYMGITPSQFIELVFKIADSLNFPREGVILGGDHLGPNRWQNEKSDSAMKKAKDQISAYVSAGYNKIHLDATMNCADDGYQDNPLSPSVIAERTALLCKAAEEAFEKSNKDSDQPVYVIGTDVPPPGGAKNNHHEIHITSTQEVEKTINLTKREFEKYNLKDAWKRVIAIVVQPGVEFGDSNVYDYDRIKSKKLIDLIEKKENLVYEAHSTDYQKKESLRKMVEDHFVFLKVGPWLTFTLREAIFALTLIEKELLFNRKDIVLSNLMEVVENNMNSNPSYWANYYGNIKQGLRLKLRYSYSDRIRYYWANKQVNKALKLLIDNLTSNKIPYTLISQFFPNEYFAIREGSLTENPEELILHKISTVLDIYNYATYGGVK